MGTVQDQQQEMSLTYFFVAKLRVCNMSAMIFFKG